MFRVHEGNSVEVGYKAAEAGRVEETGYLLEVHRKSYQSNRTSIHRYATFETPFYCCLILSKIRNSTQNFMHRLSLNMRVITFYCQSVADPAIKGKRRKISQGPSPLRPIFAEAGAWSWSTWCPGSATTNCRPLYWILWLVAPPHSRPVNWPVTKLSIHQNHNNLWYIP